MKSPSKGQSLLPILVVTLALGILFGAPAPAPSDDLRYVVPSKSGGGHALWTNWTAFNTCFRAILGGTDRDRQTFCEDGFAGIKPKVGMLEPGVEVERLDSRECRDMVYIRVLTGPLKGETGCIAGVGLTSIKPVQ